MKTKGLIGLLFATCIAAGTAGCAHDLVLSVEAPRDLNGERPVRMLVRAVDRHDFVTESYGAVAEKVVNRDDSVLLSAPIYPDIIHEAKIKRPSDKSIAVYFFFTAPGAQWKTLLETPLPDGAEIRLASDSIRAVRRLQ
jgi:hypothetical protein